MPWEKSFDRNEALETAMQLFKEKGYDGVTIADITKATGASRYGLYDEFGDKYSLYLQCLRRYQADESAHYLAPLMREDATLADLRDHIEGFIHYLNESEDKPMGCLIANCAAEFANRDDEVAAFVHDSFQEAKDAFESVLSKADASGERNNPIPAENAAELLFITMQGCYAMLKVNYDGEKIARAMRDCLCAVA